ncbi:VIT domain-containing protein [Thalassotalea fonticola]|uniref:VIT domain-containing protein n=1 Tax=Thalassotalea fonticola TaxID=3065649 RepID=A0ABZ0GKQ1_9GAMM|nr:VIT domain-containing protein [Colwelliaceae bacterium S1-1]
MNNFITKIMINTLCLGAIACSHVSFASGLLTPKDGSLPPLEIKQHHVNVVIEDGYAVTSIEQVFFNPHAIDLEATYSFPVPDKAAVGEFAYWIDGQPVIGEVVEKEQARQLYQQEKQAGREVALTEQDDYRTFDSKVYPVRAGQDVRIKLTYIQAAHVETSIGRYVYPLEDGGVDEQKLSFWNYQNKVQEHFSFNLTFRSSYPIDEFRLPKHPQALIQQTSANEWSVNFDSKRGQHIAEEGAATQTSQLTTPAAFSLEQDIVVYWRLQDGLPGTVDLVTYKEPGKERGTFMMTVTPAEDLAPITEGRDWIFVLDYSGSMSAKYQSMVDGVTKSLDKMNSNDRFKIVIFNSRAEEITNGYVNATKENIIHWANQLAAEVPGNSTNMYHGMKLAIKSLDDDRSSAIILVTDGVTNVGTTEKKAFINLLSEHDVRLFTFVMGNSANRPLLEGMVKVSNGFAINVSNSDDIVGQLMQATAKLGFQAFHDIDVKIKGVKVKDVTPKQINTLYRGQQLIVFGHYYGNENQDVELIINGKVSGQDKRYSTRFNLAQESTLNPEIERLWAFATIENLQDKMDYFGQDSDIEQAITDLAIEYGLVTNYTSMLVMREEQFAAQNIDRNNKQRVAKEQAARQKRAQAPVRNNRVDKTKPAFKSSRPSFGGGGGGSITPWMLILLLPMLTKRLLSTTES